MNVLIDASVWSLALRRIRPIGPVAEALKQVIYEGRARIIGMIRQEVLSGIASPAVAASVRQYLRAFPDLLTTTEHHEFAAEMHCQCRRRGVQGSHVDFLICAVAKRERLAIFTTDRDFERYAEVVGLSLFSA